MLNGVTLTINQTYAMIIKDKILYSSCMIVVQDKLEIIAMQVNQSYSHGQESTNYKERRYRYYHFIGHTKENCYKLVGYPTDWKQSYNANYSKSYVDGHWNAGQGHNYANTDGNSITLQIW